jgi:hypothetical protein
MTPWSAAESKRTINAFSPLTLREFGSNIREKTTNEYSEVVWGEKPAEDPDRWRVFGVNVCLAGVRGN